MFGRQKMYKAGVADTMQANADFIEKQQAAIAHMRHEVGQGVQLGIAMKNALNTLNDCYAGLSQYLNEKEKAALYKLHSSMDIKDLEKGEKYLLIAILYQLANDAKDSLTEHQQLYLRNIQKYLGISNPQIQADLDVVSDIDSLDIQKAFLECVLEFFYLQEGNEISNSQEEFLSCFSVNEKHASVIEERVAHIYEILGPAGLADKYGFIPDTIMPETAERGSEPITSVNTTDDIKDCPSQEPQKDNEPDNSKNDESTKSQQASSDSTDRKPKSKNTPASKFTGTTLGDAIRFRWMDATFAVERKVYKLRRDRVDRSADDKTGKTS